MWSPGTDLCAPTVGVLFFPDTLTDGVPKVTEARSALVWSSPGPPDASYRLQYVKPPWLKRFSS